jgi:GGDEF domain-containing protein
MLEIGKLKDGALKTNGVTDKEILRQLLTMLRGEVSPGEVIGRTDRTEFSVILPETGLDDAQILGKRVRSRAEWTFAVSYTVAEFPTHGADAMALMKAAHSVLESTRMGA